MAISRRLRFEILRRDNHQCRYCGAAAPDVKLTVDHVIPTALGGSDDATNLVTACQPCNAGKAASSPDAPLVEDVKADALRWGRAIELATYSRLADRSARDEYTTALDAAWSEWTYAVRRSLPKPDDVELRMWSEAVGEEAASKTELLAIEWGDDNSGCVLHARSGTQKWAGHLRKNALEIIAAFSNQMDDAARVERLNVLERWNRTPYKTIRVHLPRPASWKPTAWQFYAEGLPIEEVQDAVMIACSRESVSPDNAWRYFCGVCWRKLEQIREAATAIVPTLDDDPWGADGA